MAKQKLRIGLLIDNYNLPSWSFSSITSLIQSDYAKISLIIKANVLPKEHNSVGKKTKAWSYSFFRTIEKKLYQPNPDALSPKPLKSILEHCKESSIETLNAEDLKQLDLIIQFENNTIPEPILEHVKFGVWTYYFGNYSLNRKGPIGVWELFKAKDDTKVSILLKGKFVNSTSILYETSFSNDKLYTNRNANTILWKAADILPRMLEEFYTSESEAFFKKWLNKYAEAKVQSNQIYKTPNNIETIKAVSKLYWNSFKGIIKRRFYFEQWILLYQINTNKEQSKSFDAFNRLLPPKDRIWADPFVIERHGNYYIFIEEMLFNEPFGKIAVIEMDANGNHKSPTPVLEKPYHLSYPFLIEDNGELYMLPETMENNTIELYKCIDFPNKWTFEKVIMNNIKAVDSTIFKHEDKYWLFTNIEELNGTKMQSELHLFYADSLLSNNWIAHTQNPIVTDRSCARPAGNVYETNNRIFRPAQNCTKHYGYAMKINEITDLSITDFKERFEKSIFPNWSKDMFSTHTLNTSKSLTVIDAKINRKR